MMLFTSVALTAILALTPAQLTNRLPTLFLSGDQARQAGCRSAAVKGAAMDSCILTRFRSNEMELAVYDRSSDGTFRRANEMVITSWHQGAQLSFRKVSGTETDALVIDTEGMRGTGIYQRILLVILWDGARFRAVAAESLGYQCVRPTASADYKLQVKHAFEPIDGTPGLHIEYELTKDGERIHSWTNTLRWNPTRFAFVPFRVDAGVPNPIVDKIRERISLVREYSSRRPLDPVSDSASWIGESGLKDVLSPVCN